MSENYLMLNGKRVDLTEEQIEKLGLEVEKDCFDRVEEYKFYYVINAYGNLCELMDRNDSNDTSLYKTGNYCTDKSIMNQRALHETLDRLLWRFSMQNDGDKIDWKYKNVDRFTINKYEDQDRIFVCTYKESKSKGMTNYFYSREIAQRAIDEIVLPFIKEHPDYIW